ncbi:MAG: hypothetical protein KIT11_00980 [Fimbriimonadaceae bacterium]|nr:hypothetical protein [Fimbriimonadaceae bacterium]QYK55053.1 MAG: hypothetical protein KF733_08555 [Fimbriimonadaceae bacterium]
MFLRNTALMGLPAAVATTVALLAFGKAENRSAAAPINAVSHIAFGDEALTVDEPEPKYFVTGLVLNAFALFGWAGLAELWFRARGGKPSAAEKTAVSAAVTGIAYVTDFHLVPPRLSPGFEHRICRRSLYATYAVLALALAGGALLRSND